MSRLLLFLSLLFPGELWAAPSPDRAALSAPVMLEQQNLGDVWLHITTGGVIAAETASLIKVMAGALTPGGYDDLQKLVSGSRTIALDRLRPIGINLRFEEATLTLPLELADSLRSRANLNVRGENESGRTVLGAAPFSGYLNATASQGFTYPRAQARNPLRGNLSVATNLKSLVFESGATYTEKEMYAWRREDTRLIKDFESRLLRLTVGDLPVYTSGYQNSRSMAGISLTRQFSIQPYLNIRPLNRTEILIKRSSIIEVFVNDGFVSRLNAAPGPVQLADFPLFSGINKVDLKIIDDTGSVEWVNLNLLFDAQLLGEGIQQFAYHVGAPSEVFRGDRRYDDRNITYSFFHRAGLSDRLTLGASFQADRNLWLAGQDFVLLTRAGLLSGDGALSRNAPGGFTAGAGRLRYRSLDYKLGSDKPIRGAAEIEYKAKRFASLGQPNAVNDFSWKYDLSVSRPITAVTSLGLGAQFLKNRVGAADLKAARLDINSEFTPGWRLAANYGVERDSRIAHRFQFVLTWIQEEGKYFGNLSYDYPSKSTRLEAARNPSAVVDDYRATLGAQYSPSLAQADGLIEYTHEKAHLRAEHSSSSARAISGRTSSHTSTLTASTAIAWAGGAVAWSRPIADSFALLKSKLLFRAFEVPVNKISESGEATVNRFGPAVVPTLTSYNETPITLDSSSVPMGYSLGREYFLARPTYRSGVRVEVGGESSVVISGTLGARGAPLALATGQVKRGPEVVSTFFTNREGRFLIENLAPGKYTLEPDDGNWQPFIFTVGEHQAGFVKLAPHEFKEAR